jgi:hypothetical protein
MPSKRSLIPRDSGIALGQRSADRSLLHLGFLARLLRQRDLMVRFATEPVSNLDLPSLELARCYIGIGRGGERGNCIKNRGVP